MRCPKCRYISFDKVTSCSKCGTDITELVSSLNGTGFQPMNNFFLGTLLPDYMSDLADSDASSFQDAADDLDISMDDLDDLGEIGDIPGESGGVDLGLSSDYDDNTISLQGVAVPEIDLSDFEEGLDDVDTMQISSEQLEAIHSQSDEDELDLADVPDFDLEGVDLEEEEDSDVSFTDDEIDDVAESVEDNMPSLDMDMEVLDEKTEILEVADLDLGDSGDTATIDLSAIDLSLGEEELEEDTETTLADLDLGDLEMEADDEQDLDLPDLKL